MPLDWLRRLIGPPAKQPDIHVHITPGTVVRPGDTVLLCLPGQPAGTAEGIAAAAKKYLPVGAKAMVYVSEGANALNFTRSLQDVLGCDSNCGTNSRCEHGLAARNAGNGFAAGAKSVAQAGEGRRVDIHQLPEFVPHGSDAPDAARESIPPAHSEASP